MTRDPRPVALITGASLRIGRAIALTLGARGFDVAVHYRRSELAAQDLVTELRGSGARAEAFPCDLADADDVALLMPKVAVGLGVPTLLVNNASEFHHDTILTATPQSWETHIGVNLRAPVFLAQAMAKMLPAGTPANVVNIIDQRVLRLTPDFFTYTVSKAGLWSATVMLAQALAPSIRVNAVGPGPVLRSVHQTEQDFAAERDATLLKRGASPEEIAAAVAFILSSPAMTGQMITLDGGQHLSGGLAEHAPATIPPTVART